MQLSEATITTIMYEDAKGDKTARVIIPTSVPSPNMRALDVSHLSAPERVELAEEYQEYLSYLNQQYKQAWSFENWRDQTKPAHSEEPLKWRTFKTSQLIE